MDSLSEISDKITGIAFGPWCQDQVGAVKAEIFGKTVHGNPEDKSCILLMPIS